MMLREFLEKNKSLLERLVKSKRNFTTEDKKWLALIIKNKILPKY